MHKPYNWGPWQDEQIIAAYAKGERGTNKRLAARWGVLPTLVSERAKQLGCPPLLSRGPMVYQSIGWTEPEKAIVAESQGLSSQAVVARLMEAGYKRRTEAAISSIRLRMRRDAKILSTRQYFEELDFLTTEDISAGMGYSQWQIQKWIQQGKLKAKKITGKDHAVVTRAALRRFLLSHLYSWDHRKADKWFLVNILTDQKT